MLKVRVSGSSIRQANDSMQEHERRRKWLEKVKESQAHFWLQVAAFTVVSLALIIVGVVIGELLDSTDYSFWVKYLASMVPLLIGAAILARVLPLVMSRIGKFSVDFGKMKADAEYFADEVPKSIRTECLGCAILEEIKEQRWCRWRGPISQVTERRDETFLSRFFDGATEIDILTPNLDEVVRNTVASLKRNVGAKVRAMSLHPQCSATYRRFNDMGRKALGLRNRQEYSTLIHGALDDMHEERTKNKLDWKIKTYTAFPVIMIFRADNRFLLGFPLAGERVREQFHLEFYLPNLKKGCMSDSSKQELEKDQAVGIEIREDLVRHFNDIWEKRAIPWVARDKLFKKILQVPLIGLVGAGYCPVLSEEDGKNVGHLVGCLCSPEQLRVCELGSNCGLSQDQNQMLSVLEKAVESAELESIEKEYLTKEDKQSSNENLVRVIAYGFVKFVFCSFKASMEALKSQDSSFGERLADNLSRGVANKEFEFEDLKFAMSVLKPYIPSGEMPIWDEALDKMEKVAENWAR